MPEAAGPSGDRHGSPAGDELASRGRRNTIVGRRRIRHGRPWCKADCRCMAGYRTASCRRQTSLPLPPGCSAAGCCVVVPASLPTHCAWGCGAIHGSVLLKHTFRKQIGSPARGRILPRMSSSKCQKEACFPAGRPRDGSQIGDAIGGDGITRWSGIVRPSNPHGSCILPGEPEPTSRVLRNGR